MIRKRFPMIVVACMVAALTACDDDDLLVQAALKGGLPLVEAFQVPVDHSEEGSEELIRIWYSVTNRTDQTLFLVMDCHYLAVDRLEGEEWVEVWPRSTTFCTLGEPEVHWLAPGEPFGDLFEVRASDDWVAGDYRMRLNAVFAEGKTRGERQASPIPLLMRVSDPFPLEEPLAVGDPEG